MRRIALSQDLVDITREVGQLSEVDLEIARQSLVTLRESRQRGD